MKLSNLPVTSREYKLMLNTDRFKDRDKGSRIFFDLLDLLIRKEGGSVVEKQDKEESRLTSYLDTPHFALRQRGFSLRLREESGPEARFQINLKYRASDRYISAAQDVTGPEGGEVKFEEDILPPFISNFSHSNTIETDTMPALKRVDDLISLFPGLKSLNLDGDTPVKKANDFTAFEVVRKLYKFRFGDSGNIKASLSFWYLADDKDWPLVGEFSFDYDADDSDNGKNRLEQFPIKAAEGAKGLFRAMQNQSGWVVFNTTTKTAFALEVL